MRFLHFLIRPALLTLVIAALAIPAATLELQNLELGETYAAHVHAGNRKMPSASFGALGSLQADSNGFARLQTSTLTAWGSGDEIDISLGLLADGDHLIDFHASDRSRVAVGDIPLEAGMSEAGAL